MGATPETIWSVPAYLPYVQPPLTNAAITAAEQRIGYKLPAEYLNLLRVQNGGYIRFSLPEMVHSVIAGIGPHFPSLKDFDWKECEAYVSFPLKGLVPIDGDGHWHLCLDYRQNTSEPVITYADVECDHESHIADSFADYLKLLRIEVDGSYVVEGLADIEEVKSSLASSLRIEFDPPDSWAHGYPEHRARIGTTSSPQWVWISPNRVPRGFVRAEDGRYAEVKDLMPGYALQYPEAPADSFILTTTDGV